VTEAVAETSTAAQLHCVDSIGFVEMFFVAQFGSLNRY